MKKHKLEEYIERASTNITDDRAATKTLLMTIMKYMQLGDDRHKEVGLIAAKYLETLQRSNEQLVKLAALIQKKENKQEEISEEDKQELFDLINSKEDK
tara:strand:- start:57330 stop:57626 length:297 start_codon:yes stop_codon:yes gene_type:complete